MDRIGSQKLIQIRSRLGISGNIKIKELSKSKIGKIKEMIGQDHVVHWELKRKVKNRGSNNHTQYFV
ncbi:hypothetical protein MKW98_004607 [Papaver atlanticum]|uniref:Uncharacterized protein n=1 Tax=Papaver atlanticum TaxID=357466 RepID=A0AAD4SR30_9MAGN|nr:hypothetical protein MKW98_004607 [Papaver atlanticum]